LYNLFIFSESLFVKIRKIGRNKFFTELICYACEYRAFRRLKYLAQREMNRLETYATCILTYDKFTWL